MGNGTLPKKPASLNLLGTRMQIGMDALSASLKLTYISNLDMLDRRTLFAADDVAFNTARSVENKKSELFQLAMGDVYDWVMAVKKMLQASFGSYWTTQWVQVGFITPSIAIPAKIDEQLNLNLAMVAFFDKNPDYEVDKGKLTAAQGTLLHTAAITAQTNLVEASENVIAISDNWTVSYTALTVGMHALIDNLSRVLSDTDARWLRFGLQIPANLTTPAAPENLAVQFDVSGNAILTCDINPMTTRYRWRSKIIGVQADPVLAASTLEPMSALKNVLPGQTVEVFVQAVNGNLQSLPSESISFTIPSPVVQAPVAKPAVETLAESSAPESALPANGQRTTYPPSNGKSALANGTHSR